MEKFDRTGKERGTPRVGKDAKYDIRDIMDKIDEIIDWIGAHTADKKGDADNVGTKGKRNKKRDENGDKKA